jgi:hypothetical protein
MFFMHHLGGLGDVQVERPIGCFQDGARLEAVRVAGGLARHDGIPLPNSQSPLWLSVLPNEKQIALTNMGVH